MIKTFATALACLMAVTFASIASADTPLERSMQRLAKAEHQLALDLKAPQDASKADYVALATTMKTEVQKGRDLVPKKAAALPPDQQATMVAAYQKSMDDLSATIDTLTTALQASQWTDASAALTKILDQEKEGHKQFRQNSKWAGQTGTAAPAPAPSAPSPAAPMMVTPSQDSTPPQTPPAPAPMQ